MNFLYGKTECPNCKTKSLQLFHVASGNLGYHWCVECGTLAVGFIGEDKEILTPNHMRSDVEEPVENIALCHKCSNRMEQPNLFDKSFEIVGCTKLTKTQWKNGMIKGNQTNCPCLSK